MFENANEAGLLYKWKSIQDVPLKQFGVRIDKTKHPVTRKNGDIFKMLMFLNLLPTPRCSFDKAVKNLLVYTEVYSIYSKFNMCVVLKHRFSFKDPNDDPVNIRNQKLSNPYIIAAFSVVSDSVAYYIDIQDRVLSVKYN